MKLVGITGDAAVYCLGCAQQRYGGLVGTDREGNPLGAVFATEDVDYDAVRTCGCVPPFFCDDCGGPLELVRCRHTGEWL